MDLLEEPLENLKEPLENEHIKNIPIIRMIRDLGNFSGIGSIYAWILSMTLFPALLTVLPMKSSDAVDRQSRSMEWLAEMVISKRKPLMLAMLANKYVF